MKLAEERSDFSLRGGRPCLRGRRERALVSQMFVFRSRCQTPGPHGELYLTRSARLRGCWDFRARLSSSRSSTCAVSVSLQGLGRWEVVESRLWATLELAGDLNGRLSRNGVQMYRMTIASWS